jgi:hypothetical protein
MTVDEARHQQAIAGLDALDALAGDLAGRLDRSDATILDQHVRRPAGL